MIANHNCTHCLKCPLSQSTLVPYDYALGNKHCSRSYGLHDFKRVTSAHHFLIHSLHVVCCKDTVCLTWPWPNTKHCTETFLLIISIQSSYSLLHRKERRFLKKLNTPEYQRHVNIFKSHRMKIILKNVKDMLFTFLAK